jgi:hypothetical protein
LLELETDVEKKIEWTLTNHVSLAEAKKYTGGIQLSINGLKEKVKELKLIEAFNDETV